MKRGAQAAGVIVALLMAVGLGTWAFVDDMPSWKVAGLLTFVFLVVVLSVIAALVGAYHYTKLVIDSKQPEQHRMLPSTGSGNEDITDVDFRPVPVVKPRTLRLPRYVQNGMARPMLMPAATTEVVTTSEEGEEIKIELPILRRFCELNTPARSEWTGNRELYGRALAACMAQGLLDRTAKGGATWKAEYPIESRRAWLRELYNSPTRNEHGAMNA